MQNEAIEEGTLDQNKARPNTRRMTELLRHRHPAPEWATFRELRCGTGFSNRQSLDFFALNTWPSKGFQAIAYELKASRNDFARELEQPEKRAFAETVASECYFVVPQGLVQSDEVPDGWGLLVANSAGLKRLKMPTQRRPQPWPLEFAASLARRVSDPAPALPQVAWKLQEREIGEHELIAIAEATLNRNLEHERETIARNARRGVKQTREYRDLIRLRDAVGEVCGFDPSISDAERFRQWAEETSRGTPPSETIQSLRALHESLGTILNRWEKPPP